MLSMNKCIICHTIDLKRKWAIIAPFIAAYVLKTKPQITPYYQCNQCGMNFFGQRFTPEELNVLYKDYRKSHYFEQRNAFEPWYTKEINFSIGNNPAEISTRKNRVKDYIQKLTQKKQFQNVLDYGGDKGQFIPDDLFQEKMVYDISGVEVEQDVIVINDLIKLQNKTIDLIILAHVLEHASDPHELIQKCATLAKHDHTLLYVEVPNEQPIFLQLLPQFIYKTYLNFLIQFPKLLLFIDFFSTSCRHLLKLVPPFGFIKLHEHINFFSGNSLSILMEKNGFKILNWKTTQASKSEKSVIMCLAKRSH